MAERVVELVLRVGAVVQLGGCDPAQSDGVAWVEGHHVVTSIGSEQEIRDKHERFATLHLAEIAMRGDQVVLATDGTKHCPIRLVEGAAPWTAQEMAAAQARGAMTPLPPDDPLPWQKEWEAAVASLEKDGLQDFQQKVDAGPRRYYYEVPA